MSHRRNPFKGLGLTVAFVAVVGAVCGAAGALEAAEDAWAWLNRRGRHRTRHRIPDSLLGEDLDDLASRDHGSVS